MLKNSLVNIKLSSRQANNSLIKQAKNFKYPAFRSPLRYPGGKNRAVKKILHFIPHTTKTLCSPFLGGGSIELACAARGIEVFGYDIFSPLIDFWHVLLSNNHTLANKVSAHYPLSKEKFYYLQKNYSNTECYLERAAIFFVLNRCSFSGTTFSGGMSPHHPRFTLSSIERLQQFNINNLHVAHQDFQETLQKHQQDLDPPYANRQALYGDRGSTHKDFDHVLLANMLRNRKQWILSYNDCPIIRELYQEFQFFSPTWTYGMNHDKKSNEVLIFSQDLRA